MCYLAIYHPETKSWQRDGGRTLKDGYSYAIVHKGHQNSVQTVSIHGQQQELDSPCYIPCIALEPFCRRCQEILQSLYCSEDTEQRYKDALIDFL